MLAVGRKLICGGGDYIHKSRCFIAGFGYKIHIPGAGIMIIGKKAVGIGKVCVYTTQLSGLVVHHHAEVGYTAVAHIVSQNVGGLVGAGQQQGIQQLARFRTSHPIYADGALHFVYADFDCVAFVRFKDGEEVLTAVNRGDKEISFCYKDRTFCLPAMSYINDDI